jgi:hypothetical protein
LPASGAGGAIGKSLASPARETPRSREFAEDAYTKGVEGHLNVQPVIREADHREGMIFGSGWHTDSPFLARPPAIVARP